MTMQFLPPVRFNPPTQLPPYAAPVARSLSCRSPFIHVTITSPDAVLGPSMAFTPGSRLQITVEPSSEESSACVALVKAFSIVRVRFGGSAVVEEPGVPRGAAREVASIVQDIELSANATPWHAEISIPSQADCVCEWLAGSHQDRTVPLPPSVMLQEKRSFVAGKLGGKMVVSYGLDIELLPRRGKTKPQFSLSFPLLVISRSMPILDDGYTIHDSGDLSALSHRPWRSSTMDVDTVFAVEDEYVALKQAKLSVLVGQQVDFYVVVVQVAIVFDGGLSSKTAIFFRHVLSPSFITVSVGRRVRRLDRPAKLLAADEFSPVLSQQLVDRPNAEDAESSDGTRTTVVRYRQLLKVQKDDLPRVTSCDGEIDACVIARVQSAHLREDLILTSRLFPREIQSPAPPPYINDSEMLQQVASAGWSTSYVQ